jgi:hypothetical protein
MTARGPASVPRVLDWFTPPNCLPMALPGSYRMGRAAFAETPTGKLEFGFRCPGDIVE